LNPPGLRTLDQGVPHLRKIKGELLVARTKAKRAGGDDPELNARVEELLEEVARAMEARTTILRCASVYEPRSGPLSSRKRIALSTVQRSRGGSLRPFHSVLVMGIYHSCTNAISQELEKRFAVEVLNDWHTGKAGVNWKHRVNSTPLEGVPEDCLVVMMVKEPYFWLKSTSREVRNFFEVRPIRENGQGEFEDIPPKTLRDLFGRIEHDTIIYPNAVGLWNDLSRSYFDDEVYPPGGSVIIRCEDFLFRFHAVMDELAGLGLPERPDLEGGAPPDPNSDRAKGHMECRTRDQALGFYADPANRTSEFLTEELAIVAKDLDREVVTRLGYGGGDPVASWLPE